MTLYGLGTKSASALGLASIALEAHDMGKRCARRGKAQASADKFVSDNIGASKLNTESSKHNEIKKYMEHADTTDKLSEIGGFIGGYLSGVANCLKNNCFTAGFGTIGLFAKSKAMQTIALIGMGASILFDTITNATNLFERKDYIDDK